MKSVIFCKEGSSYDERWEGPRLGSSEAVEFLGIDESAPIKSLGKFSETVFVILSNFAFSFDFSLMIIQRIICTIMQNRIRTSTFGMTTFSQQILTFTKN